MNLYDNIGQNYDRTRKADSFISSRLFEYIKGPMSSKNLYLDVGCGTGNYTIALASKSLNFYGVDPSTKMITKAESRSANIKWIKAYVENLPFENLKFDGVMAILTIHHWESLTKGIVEINRVLKPSSNLVIFTPTQEQMKKYWLNYYFPKMMTESIFCMPSRQMLVEAALSQQFEILVEENYFVQDDLKDLFLYSGKNQPQLYFVSGIRNGISSFVNLATEKEISSGLKQLRKDIGDGTFAKVKATFDNTLGDYSFFVFKKKHGA